METKHDDEGCFFSLFSQKNKASLPAFGLVMFEAKGKLYCLNQKLYSCLMLVFTHFIWIKFSLWHGSFLWDTIFYLVRLCLFLLFFLWNFFSNSSISLGGIDVQIYSLGAVFFVIAIITCGASRAVIAFFPVVCLIFSGFFSNWLWCQLHVCSAPLCQSVSIYFIFIFLFLWMFTFFLATMKTLALFVLMDTCWL